jgi:hypothetical protein
MTIDSTTTSCRDSRRQRAFPDAIICMRANNRTSLTRSHRRLISRVSRRPVSNHRLWATAEHGAVNNNVAMLKQSARIDPLREVARKHSRNADNGIDSGQTLVAGRRLRALSRSARISSSPELAQVRRRTTAWGARVRLLPPGARAAFKAARRLGIGRLKIDAHQSQSPGFVRAFDSWTGNP